MIDLFISTFTGDLCISSPNGLVEYYDSTNKIWRISQWDHQDLLTFHDLFEYIGSV